MKRNQQKLTRAAELLGQKCDYSGRMYEFDRFEAKRKQEQSEEENGYILTASSWEDIPEGELLRISELVSKQQNLHKQINEKEELIRNIVWEATSLHKTTANEKQMQSINSEKSLEILKRMLAKEEHELSEQEQKLKEQEQKLKFNINEAAKLSYKYQLYQCILPLECNTLSTDPLTIKATLNRDTIDTTNSYLFSASDLHSSEATNKLWNY